MAATSVVDVLPHPDSPRPLAEVLRSRRDELGLSQADLADAVCRIDRPTVTGNDIARWERGKRIPRTGARRALEIALQLPVLHLDAAAAAQRAVRAPATETVVLPHESAVNPAIDRVRASLLDSSLAALHLGDGGDGPPPPLAKLNRDLDRVMGHYQSSRFDTMLAELPDLIRGAHITPDRPGGASSRKAKRTLALSNQAAAMVLTKVGEHDLAWIASERGLAVADQADDRATYASLRRSAVHTLQSQGRTEAATKLAERTADELRSDLAVSSSDEEVALYGTLLLAGSMAATRRGDSAGATEYLDEADHYANQLTSGTDHLWTAFSAANVAVHRVGAAVALDDIAAAEEHVGLVDVDALLSERRVRFLFDKAMIAVRRDDTETATAVMTEAEALAPEQVHNHLMAQQIVAHLRNTKAGRQDPRLAQLDQRARRTRAVAPGSS
ncbi:MAG: helix-turn-helix transcriptional regulator [Actinomycetota bacterium]